jgi:hypothetical protein
MFTPRILHGALLVALALAALPATAADSAELQRIHEEINALRKSYDARIADLEARLKQAETQAAEARGVATQAEQKATEVASQAAAPTAAPAPAAASNAFNPDIAVIFSGIYANLSQNPDNYRITGFISGNENGPVKRGFSLAETELDISGNIDPWYFASMSLALTPDNEAEVEEAFIQTIALPHGFTAKAGRYLSSIGYLNSQHAHTWDFVDAPLAYQAFLGGQFNDDGAQLRWVAPTETFLELGAEVGRGRPFPGSDENQNGVGATALYAHLGGDVGVSHNWRAGLSWLRATPQDREYDDLDAGGVTNAFSGTSQLWLADFVWKWAPNGNGERTNFKLQGEYFRRHEDGTLVYDVGGANSPGSYSSTQSGWYLQSVYQFMPGWRVGARWDQLQDGKVKFGANSGALSDPGYNPSKATLMVDWSQSEFSRWRLQVARDKSRQDETDNQLFVQYIMSLGAHGAHSY